MMRNIWSVLMRWIKTPPNDYFQSQHIAPLKLKSPPFHLALSTMKFSDRYLRYGASQADVAAFKAVPSPPKVEKFPNAYRWYNHIKSYESEFSTLPGDPSKGYTTYGPEAVQVTSNPKEAPKDEEEEEEEDLFASDEEEEDPEVVAERERRLADYKKKKEGKAKPAAKSIVTMDVKPWGKPPDAPLQKTESLQSIR
jgi:Eukaryotic elongation factor 1 beta central acidic region